MKLNLRHALACWIAVFASCAGYAQDACRSANDNEHIKFNATALTQLSKTGLGQRQILDAVVATARPESNGCWSSASGDFDGQIVSVGIAQWNYGQKTLQPLLRRFRESFPRNDLWNAQIEQLMPTHGKTVFSSGCLRDDLTSDCLALIAVEQVGHGRLSDNFRRELNALFESDLMTQIQVDTFVRVLTSVASDLGRVFPKMQITPLRVKWAIDTKIQQGGFPGDLDIERVRKKWTTATVSERKAGLAGIIKWYEGLCASFDQDGVRYDCDYNTKQWTRRNAEGTIDSEAADLIILSHLKSRTAVNKSGLYQADTFQRRVKIALGIGSVHGARH